MKKLTSIGFAAALLTIPTFAGVSPYALIGLTPGQTLRLNAANPAIAPSAVASPPDPCRVELSFVDSDGKQLLPAVQKTLQPGQSTHYDLNGDLLFPPGTVNLPAVQRAEIRPVLLVLPNPAATIAAARPGRCVSSFEIIDNTSGKTLVTSGPDNPGARVGFNPQPDPPGKIFGQLGIVAGQTIRVAAANVLQPDTTLSPPDPCRVGLTFFDENGNMLAHAAQILQPGQAAALDYTLPVAVTGPPGVTASGPMPPVPMHNEVRAEVAVQSLGRGASPPDPCRASLEVFDNDTGKTTAFQSPQVVEPPPDPD